MKQTQDSSSNRLGSLRRRVQNDVTLSELSRELLHALGNGDLDATRQVLARIPPLGMRAVLLTPSNDAALGLQTPLMRAASRYALSVWFRVGKSGVISRRCVVIYIVACVLFAVLTSLSALHCRIDILAMRCPWGVCSGSFAVYMATLGAVDSLYSDGEMVRIRYTPLLGDVRRTSIKVYPVDVVCTL